MKHSELIKPEFIDRYVEIHKMLYRTLSIMVSDISFIRACVELQDHDLQSDWISIKYLHGAVFENLIIKTYRCFFDNSGSDATNLLKFKNSIIGEFLKEEYVDTIKSQMADLRIDELVFRRTIFERVEKNVTCLRNQYIAHGLINQDEATVDLDDIEELLKCGIELFQKLSFETRGFYTFGEGNGYDFSNEISYTRKSLSNLIRYTMLSSTHISKIICEYDSECEEPVLTKVQKLVEEINISKESQFNERTKREDAINTELERAQAMLDNNPVLALSPGDLSREGKSIEEYLVDFTPSEQEKYREYYEEEL